MGWTYVSKAVGSFVGYPLRRQESFTVQGGDVMALALPLFAVVPDQDRGIPEHNHAVNHAENKNERQRFVIRGGFYKMADSKRRLFFAGRLYKPGRTSL